MSFHTLTSTSKRKSPPFPRFRTGGGVGLKRGNGGNDGNGGNAKKKVFQAFLPNPTSFGPMNHHAGLSGADGARASDLSHAEVLTTALHNSASTTVGKRCEIIYLSIFITGTAQLDDPMSL